MNYVGVILLWGIFLSPSVQIISSLPKVRLDDFLAYIILLWVLLGGYPMRWFRSAFSIYATLICVMSCWVLVTILVNNRIASLADYFEIYKHVKYLLVMFLFYKLALQQKNNLLISKNIIYIFVALVIFNLMNLLNFASFNTLILPLYAPEGNIASNEGLEKSEKALRMLGTMGNPNANAILWGGVTAALLSLRSLFVSYRTALQWCALISGVMCVLSQSRTTFVALVIGLLVYVVITMRKKDFGKIFFTTLLLGAGGYAVITLLNLDYLLSIWETDIEQNDSWLERLLVWDYLYTMIQSSPWFGYGPDKDFFYNNEIYAENEYILNTWRYGYIGVVLYLSWLALPWFYAKKMASNLEAVWTKSIVIVAPLYAMSAITNNPMNEPRLNLLYAVICGLMFAEVETTRKHDTNRQGD